MGIIMYKNQSYGGNMVTNENIKEALGYTPANKIDVDELAKKISQVPVSANNGVMQSIYNVVRSYLHNNDNLVYGHAKGSTDPNHTEQGGNAMHYEDGVETITITRGDVSKTGYCINCSTFVHLVLLGVPYEKSMYNPYYNALKHNCINSLAYSFNMWGEDITADNYKRYLYTWNMAKRFRELGLGFKPNANFSNIAEGDVVFFKRSDSKGTDDELDDTYHVGIVLAKHIGEYKEGDDTTILYTFAEVMSREDSVVTVRTITMDSKQLLNRRVFYVGRPIYNTVPDGKRLIGCKKGIARNITFDVSGFDLRSQDMVTLCFDYTPTSPTEYIQCYCNDVVMRRYVLNVTNNITDGEVGVTKRLMLPVRLSDNSPNGYLGDDWTTKINSIRLTSIAKNEEDSNVATNGISNLSIWEGLNGDFITDHIVIEDTTTVEV